MLCSLCLFVFGFWIMMTAARLRRKLSDGLVGSHGAGLVGSVKSLVGSREAGLVGSREAGLGGDY